MPDIDDSKLTGMAEALGSEEAEKEAPQEVAEVPKIKVGEQEYTNDELNELVGLGSRARELGNAHGGFDKFVSEFGRKSDTIGKLKQQLEGLEKSKEAGTLTDTGEDQLEQARQAARKLGIVLKEDLDTYSENYYTNRRAGEKLLESCTELSTEIDGTDGRPKFDTQKVLEFMNENPGFKDPKKAYEAMNLEDIVNWKAEHVQKSRSKGITTITQTSGKKMPADVRPNKDNLLDFVKEAMNG